MEYTKIVRIYYRNTDQFTEFETTDHGYKYIYKCLKHKKFIELENTIIRSDEVLNIILQEKESSK